MAKGLDGDAIAVTDDVSREVDVFGRVDLHHLNAGVPGPPAAFEDLTADLVPYHASKHGVLGLVRRAAVYAARSGCGSTRAAPGIVPAALFATSAPGVRRWCRHGEARVHIADAPRRYARGDRGGVGPGAAGRLHGPAGAGMTGAGLAVLAVHGRDQEPGYMRTVADRVGLSRLAWYAPAVPGRT